MIMLAIQQLQNLQVYDNKRSRAILVNLLTESWLHYESKIKLDLQRNIL